MSLVDKSRVDELKEQLAQYNLKDETLYRVPYILAGLEKGQSYETIAKGIPRLDGKNEPYSMWVIFEDMKALRDSGFFGAWLQIEWWRLFEVIRANGAEGEELAFKELTKLLMKDMGNKISINQRNEVIISERNQQDVRRILADYKFIFEGASIPSPIPEDSVTEPLDTIRPNGETGSVPNPDGS